MIANGIKLVQLGAVICVLLPLMNLELISGEDELSVHDEKILMKLETVFDITRNKVKNLLEQVHEKDRAKICGVSVTDLYSISESGPCNRTELLRRAEIYSWFLGSTDSLKSYVDMGLKDYVNSCFNSTDIVTQTFNEGISATDKATIITFYDRIVPENKKIDPEVFGRRIRRFCFRKVDPDLVEKAKTSCKAVIGTKNILLQFIRHSKDSRIRELAWKLRDGIDAKILDTCGKLVMNPLHLPVWGEDLKQQYIC